MAYLKQEKRGKYTYLTICKSYRDSSGKPQRKVLGRLGNWEAYEAEDLKQIGRALYALGGGNIADLSVLDTSNKIQELGRYQYGFPLITKHLMRIFRLDSLLSRFERSHKLQYSLFDVLALLLCARWQRPCSKLETYESQSSYLGLKSVDLHHLYRSLDILSKYEEAIQHHFYQHQKELLTYQLAVVFFDVTTLYFCSQIEEEGNIRQKGFSKDGKIGKTQVVFALLIDINKQPVGYELYAGDQYEGHTLLEAIHRLKHRYQLGRVTVVADRGMMNKDNLSAIVKADYEYIIGERLKNIGQQAQAYLLNLSHYKEGHYCQKDGTKVKVKYATYTYKGRTLIGTYSSKRAKKDKADRKAKLEKGKQLLKKKHLLKQKASLYFLKNTTEQTYVVDEEKIKAHQRFDGFAAIATSNPNLDIPKAIDQYRHLFQIEQVFRTFKTHLEIRPMFHWTESRIRGHIAICYMNFCLMNYLQQLLLKQGVKLSENKIRKAIDSMQVSKISIAQKVYYLTAKQTKTEKQILNTLNIKPLNEFILGHEMENIIQKF